MCGLLEIAGNGGEIAGSTGEMGAVVLLRRSWQSHKGGGGGGGIVVVKRISNAPVECGYGSHALGSTLVKAPPRELQRNASKHPGT